MPTAFRSWLAIASIALSAAGTLGFAGIAQAQNAAVFDALYTQLHIATAAKDSAALAQLMAPGYRMTDIQGDTHGFAQVQERLAKLPSDPARKPKITVLSVTVTGASALIKQRMELHMSRPGADGTPAELDITALSDDVWAPSGGTWQLLSSEQRDLSVSKDGEVVFHQAR